MEVTKGNYFEDTGHLSVSRVKRFLKCEVQGITEWVGKSDALLFGSYVDAHVEGTLEEFKTKNPEMISSQGKTKGQLKSAYSQIGDICDFIDNDATIQQFLSGEKQVIMTDEINGVPFKIMMDSYSKGIAISDLKVMRSITDRSGKYYDFITQWGYQYQGACYQEIVRKVTGEQLPFFIVVVTKETPINSAVIQIPQLVLDRALYEVESNIERFYDVMKNPKIAVGCGVCADCVGARKSTPIISMDDLVEGGII